MSGLAVLTPMFILLRMKFEKLEFRFYPNFNKFRVPAQELVIEKIDEQHLSKVKYR